MEEYVIDKLFINTWGIEKTAELVLIAVLTATTSVIIANHLIPNKPAIKLIAKEN